MFGREERLLVNLPLGGNIKYMLDLKHLIHGDPFPHGQMKSQCSYLRGQKTNNMYSTIQKFGVSRIALISITFQHLNGSVYTELKLFVA